MIKCGSLAIELRSKLRHVKWLKQHLLFSHDADSTFMPQMLVLERQRLSSNHVFPDRGYVWKKNAYHMRTFALKVHFQHLLVTP